MSITEDISFSNLRSVETFRSVEPRQALGMIEPGHYLLISVQGRNRDSKGTVLQRVAEMMKDRGVQQALPEDASIPLSSSIASCLPRYGGKCQSAI